MSISKTQITGVRAGQPNHLILDFNTTFIGAEGVLVNFSLTVNGNAPVGKQINLTDTVPSQSVNYGGVDGTFTLENNSYVTFKGTATWGGQIAVQSLGGIVIAMK